MKKTELKNNIVIFQGKDGKIEFRGDFKNETVWATQKQVAELFGVDRSVVTKHIGNIFKQKELNKKEVCAKFAHTTQHGAIKEKMQTKDIMFYNLDLIISVGYRVNSKTATELRKWATNILKQHLIKGYTINRKQIAKNYNEFIKTVNSIQNLLPEHITLDPKMIIELIKEFAGTWETLEAYDKDELGISGVTKKEVKFSGEELRQAIESLRKELIINKQLKSTPSLSKILSETKRKNIAYM